jgi:hypothetical protein
MERKRLRKAWKLKCVGEQWTCYGPTVAEEEVGLGVPTIPTPIALPTGTLPDQSRDTACVESDPPLYEEVYGPFKHRSQGNSVGEKTWTYSRTSSYLTDSSLLSDLPDFKFNTDSDNAYPPTTLVRFRAFCCLFSHVSIDSAISRVSLLSPAPPCRLTLVPPLLPPCPSQLQSNWAAFKANEA